MAEKKEPTIYEFNAQELIQSKELRLTSLRSKYYQVITKEREIKNSENTLYLNTDFKELKLTNDKMRTAYINNALHKEKFELTQLKYELKQEEDSLQIINDLISLRLKEIGE